MKIYKPVVYEPHSMKWPHLERNIYIFLAVLLFAGIAFGIYRMEKFESNRARIQHEQEQKAIQDKHAANIVPFRPGAVQTIPDWVFEARKPKP
jgi:hypothetical protein